MNPDEPADLKCPECGVETMSSKLHDAEHLPTCSLFVVQCPHTGHITDKGRCADCNAQVVARVRESDPRFEAERDLAWQKVRELENTLARVKMLEGGQSTNDQMVKDLCDERDTLAAQLAACREAIEGLLSDYVDHISDTTGRTAI